MKPVNIRTSRKTAPVVPDRCSAAMLANINQRYGGSPILSESAAGVLVPGEIYLANEARFIEANFSEPLTTYAVGWKDPNNIEQTLEFFAPETPTSRRFEYSEFTNSEEFLEDTGDDSDIRASGAAFKQVDFTGKKTLGKTFNKGLTTRVDLDNVDQNSNWQERRTGTLMRRLLRSELRRAVALLSAASTNLAKTWTSGTPNPDGDARASLLLAATASGIRPTRAGYGDTAWDSRATGFESLNTAGGFAGAARDEVRLAGYLGLQQVMVSRERYQSTASAKAEILNNLVLLFNASSGAGEDDPSNIKRFTSPVEGGGKFRVYVQQISAHLVDITVEHYSNIVITSTLGIRKLTIS